MIQSNNQKLEKNNQKKIEKRHTKKAWNSLFLLTKSKKYGNVKLTKKKLKKGGKVYVRRENQKKT